MHKLSTLIQKLINAFRRLFPNAQFITELTFANNMRFMQFNARDQFAMNQVSTLVLFLYEYIILIYAFTVDTGEAGA